MITWSPRPPRSWPNQNQVKKARNDNDALDRLLVYDRPGPSSAATKRAMRFVRWFTPGWVLFITVLVNARRPPPLPRSFLELSSEEISSLVKVKDPLKNLDPHDPNSHLSKILIPRPGECARCSMSTTCMITYVGHRTADTANNTQVRNYIIDTLKKLKWEVEEDTFTDQTPYGVKTFTNVIATKDPKASRRVIVAAHFDSKYFPSYPENQVRVDRAPLYRGVWDADTTTVRRRYRLRYAVCSDARSRRSLGPAPE